MEDRIRRKNGKTGLEEPSIEEGRLADYRCHEREIRSLTKTTVEVWMPCLCLPSKELSLLPNIHHHSVPPFWNVCCWAWRGQRITLWIFLLKQRYGLVLPDKPASLSVLKETFNRMLSTITTANQRVSPLERVPSIKNPVFFKRNLEVHVLSHTDNIVGGCRLMSLVMRDLSLHFNKKL